MAAAVLRSDHSRYVCGLTQEVARFRVEHSAGGTQTDAVGKTALPEKSLMNGAKIG